MASLQVAIGVLGDVSETRHRRCLDAKAIGVFGESEHAPLLWAWGRDPEVQSSCRWGAKKLLMTAKPAGNVNELIACARVEPERLKYWHCAGD